ncbi:MAG TPA: immunoglobulin domain-containing protein [Opitutaceae bacterium]|nr:immunoglobulin domain-containing protein [Opitutaceae bacterium]
MRFASFLFLLAASAASSLGETKILLNKTSASSVFDVQQVTVPEGERVVLMVPVLSGNVWYKNGDPVPTGDGRVLIIDSVTKRDAGRYRVGYVSDESSASQEVVLNVAPAASSGGRLHTFTTRGYAGAGAQSLVAGFAIGETDGDPTATRQVLIRAVGPTLEDFGVNGYIKAPQLAVFDSSGERIQHSTTDPLEIAKATLATGAFPLKRGGADAVLLLTLKAGTYTAQVSGIGQDSGLVMLDVHEVPASK